jgi:RNA-directed DNA polymerase
MRWPRPKSREKFKEAIRQKTPRTRSGSMEPIVEDLNRTRRGWFNYFQHSMDNIFEGLDQWTRGRLRRRLRKRHKGHGRARGRDHQRWPNTYFAELGLISLALARAKAAKARQEAH